MQCTVAMGKKQKLRERMADAEVTGPALVICVGKKCAPRDVSRALAAHAATRASGTPVRVETVGCLHVCKRGPIAATYPKIRFKKRVDEAKADKLIAKLANKFEATVRGG